MSDKTYDRALKIMRAVQNAGTIEYRDVAVAVRVVVPDATDDEIKATMVYLGVVGRGGRDRDNP